MTITKVKNTNDHILWVQCPLDRSYGILSFDFVPNHNPQNFVPLCLVMFHNQLVPMIESNTVPLIAHDPGC